MVETYYRAMHIMLAEVMKIVVERQISFEIRGSARSLNLTVDSPIAL